MLIRPDVERAALTAALGMQPNDANAPWPLPNVKDSNEWEYWNFRASWGDPQATAYAGHRKIDDEWYTLLLTFENKIHHAGGGFAVLVPQKDHLPVRHLTWANCAHEFVYSTPHMYEHVHTCKHCKRQYAFDSSD